MINEKTEFELKGKVIVVEDIVDCENYNLNSILHPIMELDLHPDSSDEDIEEAMVNKISNQYIDGRISELEKEISDLESIKIKEFVSKIVNILKHNIIIIGYGKEGFHCSRSFSPSIDTNYDYAYIDITDFNETEKEIACTVPKLPLSHLYLYNKLKTGIFLSITHFIKLLGERINLWDLENLNIYVTLLKVLTDNQTVAIRRIRSLLIEIESDRKEDLAGCLNMHTRKSVYIKGLDYAKF